MPNSIKSIFEQECAGLKIDRSFYKTICELEAKFVNKKQDHIEFFGGTLTGVKPIRFTDEDRDKLFLDILEVDDKVLESKLYALPAINPEFIVSSDIFNIACVWIMHAFDASTHLNEEEKHEGKIRICLYLQYKFLTSRLFRHFRYPADPEVAAATYAQLSYRYALKAHGSWGAALRARAEEVIGKDSIHFKTIKNLDNDERVVYMLNDVQGRIRDMLKNIYDIFLKVHAQGKRITNTASLIETDGEFIMKDKTKSLSNYTRYIRSVVPDQNSFIRQELVDVIADVMQTMPPKLLEKTLSWCSRNYSHINNNEIEKAIDLIMEHAFEYLSENRETLRASGDIAGLISKLRGVYMSSRTTDTRMILIRSTVENIVKEATKSKNESVVSATRTGFMLYIILRAFTKRHYTSQ
jgi:hypothetical protein